MRGILGLIWAITISAEVAAAMVTSTEMPRLIQPKSSGGETWIIATLSGILRLRKRSGTSDMFIGVIKRFCAAIAADCTDPR